MPIVKLNDALIDETPRSQSNEIVRLNGLLTSDPDRKRFRLYPDGSNHQRYYRISKEDVVGDIYEWEKEELAQGGFIGQRRFCIELQKDTNVQFVSIVSGPISSLPIDLSIIQQNNENLMTDLLANINRIQERIYGEIIKGSKA